MKATLRPKKRYVAFKCVGSDSEAISEREAKEEVQKSILAFFGELGYSELNYKFIGYDAKSKTGVVRCTRGKEQQIIACLSLVSSVAGKKARTMPVSVSGTLLTLKEKFTDE